MDPPTSDQDIVVRITKSFGAVEFSCPRLKKLVQVTCSRFKVTDATVGVAIVDDSQIRKLNKRFLNSNRATDCLSFDLSDGRGTHKSPGTVGGRKAKPATKCFELVVNGERAAKEAARRGHSAEAELALYTLHSLLHNLGFDDADKGLAGKMHQMEDDILNEQGYGLVYDAKGER